MVCFRYIIVNNRHKCDNKDDDDGDDDDDDDDNNNNNNNNNNRPKKVFLKLLLRGLQHFVSGIKRYNVILLALKRTISIH